MFFGKLELILLRCSWWYVCECCGGGEDPNKEESALLIVDDLLLKACCAWLFVGENETGAEPAVLELVLLELLL